MFSNWQCWRNKPGLFWLLTEKMFLQNFPDQDILGQAFEDALEVLQQQSDKEMQYSQGKRRHYSLSLRLFIFTGKYVLKHVGGRGISQRWINAQLRGTLKKKGKNVWRVSVPPTMACIFQVTVQGSCWTAPPFPFPSPGVLSSGFLQPKDIRPQCHSHFPVLKF